MRALIYERIENNFFNFGFFLEDVEMLQNIKNMFFEFVFVFRCFWIFFKKMLIKRGQNWVIT